MQQRNRTILEIGAWRLSGLFSAEIEPGKILSIEQFSLSKFILPPQINPTDMYMLQENYLLLKHKPCDVTLLFFTEEFSLHFGILTEEFCLILSPWTYSLGSILLSSCNNIYIITLDTVFQLCFQLHFIGHLCLVPFSSLRMNPVT